MKTRAWREPIGKKMYVASNSLSYRNYVVSQVDTNIPDLETKVSFVSLKDVTRPQMDTTLRIVSRHSL